ncbi:MAG: DUF6163 family protein [Rhizobiaceae bacterium]
MSAHIEAIAKPPSRMGRWTQIAFNLFLRLLAIAFFGLSLYTWLSAIGYWEGANLRFDTMSVQWKIYMAILLVLNPVTTVGLWTTLSWGRVVWLLAIGVQIVGLLRYDIGTMLGKQVMYFHLGTLALYVIFQMALRFINKEE